MPRALDLERSIEHTTQAVLARCVPEGLFVGLPAADHRAKAHAIATFACLCAPPEPKPESLVLAARLVALLLFFDDLPKAELTLYVEESRPVLDHLQVPASAHRPVGALLEYLLDLERHADTSGFRRQLARMFDAVIDEAALLASGRMSTSTYEASRLKTIFVDEYLWTWLISDRMPTDDASWEQTVRLRRLASELVYLVNDVGSAPQRDRSHQGADPNLVLLIERENGLTPAQALELVIRRHNQLAVEYHRELGSLLARAATRSLRALASVVDFTVRGNLATTRRLSGSRYAGSQQALSGLCEYLDDPVSPQ